MNPKKQRPELETRAKLNLLLVDDDEIALFTHRRLARLSGFFESIRSATNGLQAFDHLHECSEGTVPTPDVILLDLDMPVMSGTMLLKVFRMWEYEHKENITFVVLTDGDDGQRELTELGVRYFLCKPLSLGMLNDVIASIIVDKKTEAVV